MNHRFTRSYLIAFLSGVSISACGQDFHLSQFYEAPLLRNPALAGIFTGDYRVQAVYRNQWNSVTIPYQTGALSGEARFPVGKQNDFVTIGLQMAYDQAGTTDLKTTLLMPAINYHKSLSRDRPTFLSLGFMGGFTQRGFDPSKITTNNQYQNGGYDPGTTTGENFVKDNFLYIDGAVGLSFSSSVGNGVNYFLGASYYHFNKPKVSFYANDLVNLAPKIQFNAGITVPVTENMKIVGQFNESRQGVYTETIGGGMVGFALLKQGLASDRMFYIGLLYRLGDAIIPVVNFDMDSYEIGMSYDVNVSALKTASQGMGGFELSFSYMGFFTSPNSSLNKVNCPRF
ncbi:MAG TPA: PorP/SprF family type IX secretion system membrane protein [Chitinophagaceae bacterium]|nr:PorP/SprF family type IX secretion system membrane protein [Chitinophagaceae bacterium]